MSFCNQVIFSVSTICSISTCMLKEHKLNWLFYTPQHIITVTGRDLVSAKDQSFIENKRQGSRDPMIKFSHILFFSWVGARVWLSSFSHQGDNVDTDQWTLFVSSVHDINFSGRSAECLVQMSGDETGMIKKVSLNYEYVRIEKKTKSCSTGNFSSCKNCIRLVGLYNFLVFRIR